MALQPQSSRSRRSKSDLSNDLATYRDALPANKAVRQHLHDVRLTCATLRPRHAQHVGARAFQRRPRPFGANELCWPGAISVTFVVFPFRGYSLVPQHFINGARTFLPLQCFDWHALALFLDLDQRCIYGGVVSKHKPCKPPCRLSYARRGRRCAGAAAV